MFLSDVVGADLVISYRLEWKRRIDAFTMRELRVRRNIYCADRTEFICGNWCDSWRRNTQSWRHISAGVEPCWRKAKHPGMIRELVGHGVGLSMHMEPEIPNYGRRELVRCCTLATVTGEPMASGRWGKIITDERAWTLVWRELAAWARIFGLYSIDWGNWRWDSDKALIINLNPAIVIEIYLGNYISGTGGKIAPPHPPA